MKQLTNSFTVSVDITVMINILQDILHEKMLKAKNLYWFCIDAIY